MAFIKKIKTYTIQDGFFIEVDSAYDILNFYLCHQDYGQKLYMFGLRNDDIDSIDDVINDCANTYINDFLEELNKLLRHCRWVQLVSDTK